MIVYLSDGLANTGATVASVAVPAGITIKAFAVGGSSSCSSDPNSLGSLDDVAAKGGAGSNCTPVPNVADLPDVVPGVVNSQLTSLSLTVDGGAPTDITGNASPALPQPAPPRSLSAEREARSSCRSPPESISSACARRVATAEGRDR
jgi:hypothetical protein